MLSAMRIFIKVVELGSFSKAAEVLNMAPSSVARNIDNLEQDFNAVLLKRSTRQLLLTEAGEQFLTGARKLVSDEESLKASLSQQELQPEGVLRISVFEGFGRVKVCPILPGFLAQYPKVKIEIDLDNQLVDLHSENIDIAIRIGSPADSSLHARMLMTNQTSLCASPTYLAQFGSPKKPDDLLQHNCLLLDRDRQRTYWHFHKAKQYKKVPVQGNLTSRGGTPILEAAIHHGGIVLLSSWMMDDLIQDGSLVRCLPEWTPSLSEQSSGDIYALYSGGKHMRPVIRAFIDYLVKALKL
ncbi:transcriptional regulator, LysR family [Shewanella halifaxensis HAW-EB4]|uniref:Transcriptional regulator, LysR family n=1 Tax=Shewanella halifaxensis (strain HAW-EB4) TaxID=458817 RepID=B0TRR3_SHEHH|nr:LysR family transcriptional regulator [Shewanella halifaxensis]ABZ77825.1 transcriptional regulator, LysR family [Shewanella halifaxensis HAW-EB4]